MTVWLSITAGCTTIVVPGWAAIGVIVAAAAPRLLLAGRKMIEG